MKDSSSVSPAIEKQSFILGMIAAFSECVAAGCKRLALSPPLTAEEYQKVADRAYEIIEKHGLLHFHEKNLDQPDNIRCEWILIAGKQETIDQYLRLREQGISPMVSLDPFSELLSYRPSESIHTGYDVFRELFRDYPEAH